MKIHYMGKYNMDESTLPSKPHRPGMVPFREIQDMKKLGLYMQLIGLIIMVIIAIPVAIRCHSSWDQVSGSTQFLVGCLASCVVFFPHEYIHACFFREDSYVFTNLRHGMLFVFGPEDMTRRRFIIMSLMPTLVFGPIPYIIGLADPHLIGFAVFGILNLGAGVGDYYNIYNALTQVPKDGLIYMYGVHSFWYRPDDQQSA